MLKPPRFPKGIVHLKLKPKLLCNFRDFCFYTLIKMNFERQDYATAFSQGFVHRKHKPKIAAQFSGFLFLNAYQNKF